MATFSLPPPAPGGDATSLQGSYYCSLPGMILFSEKGLPPATVVMVITLQCWLEEKAVDASSVITAATEVAAFNEYWRGGWQPLLVFCWLLSGPDLCQIKVC